MSKDLAVSIITPASLSFTLSVRGHRMIIRRSFTDGNVVWSITLHTLIAEFLFFISRRYTYRDMHMSFKFLCMILQHGREKNSDTKFSLYFSSKRNN